MSEAPKPWAVVEHTVSAPASLIERLRRDSDEVSSVIVGLPRAADLSDADAQQIVHGLMRVAIEAAEGTSTTTRDLVLETMRDFVESGRPLGDAIRGISRVYLLLSPIAVAPLPEGDRQTASIWFAEFASTFLRDVVKVCSAAR